MGIVARVVSTLFQCNVSCVSLDEVNLCASRILWPLTRLFDVDKGNEDDDDERKMNPAPTWIPAADDDDGMNHSTPRTVN